MLHRQRADLGRRDLRCTGRPQLRLDGVRRLVGGRIGHGAASQRLAEAGSELLAVEFLADSVALDDDEAGRLDALIGREAGRAGGAFAAAADGRGVIEVTRVDDPRLPFAAMRAAHQPSSFVTPLAVVVYSDDTTTYGGQIRAISARRGAPTVRVGFPEEVDREFALDLRRRKPRGSLPPATLHPRSSRPRESPRKAQGIPMPVSPRRSWQFRGL